MCAVWWEEGGVSGDRKNVHCRKSIVLCVWWTRQRKAEADRAVLVCLPADRNNTLDVSVCNLLIALLVV